ncbi:unnamed protein product [Cyclocybe aegerita]|uniref:GTP binding protein 2 n=1 Tax=Cyclocybe aegerita TaxID=1973307 RepID=A0A8S0WPV5_CYCAE|nr:unnamed protein product [Cyclocybe aegerita]
MFGESESESPRVPSPWDSLISTPPSPKPFNGRAHTPSPLAVELIPRLVPESDDGNVEYKLQLLNPSPARFARLVTQMKWRLLEGGGQAYYELGVADSGDLIGLPREELEQSLETLEMMAGEIGASVIVVKEIEVPAVLATLAKRSGDRRRRDGTPSSLEGSGYSTTETTETEAESTDADEDMSLTIVLEKDAQGDSSAIFAMDPDEEKLITPQTRFSIDLEISSVFKPRPMKARMHNHPHPAHTAGGKNKRAKKHKHLAMLVHNVDPEEKNQQRRQNRDKRREEKRKALEARAETIPRAEDTAVNVDALVNGLESLHVGLVEEPTQIVDALPTIDAASAEDFDDDDDVFASPKTAVPSFPTFSASTTGESHLDVDATVIGIVGAMSANGEVEQQPRLIVEALVVRKMSLEEAFLDFGGFSLT